jgi:hypothetical protein
VNRYYDRQGNLIPGSEWSLADNTLLKTTVSEHFDVSTIYLGLDHNWGDGPPLIFETMVFSDGPLNQDCERYTTEEQAREGHTRWVKRAEEAEAGRLHPEPSDVADDLMDVLRKHFGYLPDEILSSTTHRTIHEIAQYQRDAVMES